MVWCYILSVCKAWTSKSSVFENYKQRLRQIMPRFRSRSIKIEPYSNHTVNTLLFTKVIPNFDVFTRTQDSCPTFSQVRLSSKKPSYTVLSRMDDPEEVLEFFPAPSGLNPRQRVSLPTCPQTLQGNQEYLPFFPRSSVDFSQLREHTFQVDANEWMVKSRQHHEERCAVTSCREKIFEKRDVISKMKDTMNADGNVDSRLDAKPLQNSEKFNHLEVKSRKDFNQVKTMDISEWTRSSEKCYRCILSLRQDKSLGCKTALTLKKRLHDQPVVVADLENFQHFPISPDIQVFSAVEDNLKDELENLILNYKIDLNFCYNSKNLTPLHLAAQLGFTQCVQVLLKHGSNVNSLNSDNRSPLYMAFTRQHFECALLLIESGADIQQFTTQKLNEFQIAKQISETYKRSFVAQV